MGVGTGEWHRKGGKRTSEMDICLFPTRVLPGVLIILFLVTGETGAWRGPEPDDSTASGNTNVLVLLLAN